MISPARPRCRPRSRRPRALDQLGVGSGSTLLINGASGSVGSAAVQLAVVTLADFGGAQEHGVRFSSGDAGRALYVLAEIGELIGSGRFSLPVARPSRCGLPPRPTPIRAENSSGARRITAWKTSNTAAALAQSHSMS